MGEEKLAPHQCLSCSSCARSQTNSGRSWFWPPLKRRSSVSFPPFPHQQANPPAAITNMGQSLNALSGRAAAAEASQPPPSPPGYAAAEARARELLAGPFSCYADEVKGTGAAMRQLFDAWDAAGPGAPPPAWDILRGRPGGCLGRVQQHVEVVVSGWAVECDDRNHSHVTASSTARQRRSAALTVSAFRSLA